MESKTPEVQNIILYIDDAVRFDYAKDRLSSIGETYKTVSSSVHTPASFTSIFTGLHVPQHGVTGFGQRLSDDIFTIFDIKTHEVKMAEKGVSSSPIRDIFPRAASGSIDFENQPFIHIIWGPGGHAPYGGFEFDDYSFSDLSASEYFDKAAGDTDRLQRDYKRGVEQSIDEFSRLVEDVVDRGLADDTLIIYTSDHGELIGEYGLIGHNHLCCPELVYTPTTLVHPSLDSGVNDGILSHVDLLPAVAESIDYADNRIPNSSLGENRGYSHFETEFYGDHVFAGVNWVVKSLWSGDGGYSFNQASIKDALSLYIGLLLKSHKGTQIRSSMRYIESIKQFIPGKHVYHSPSFSAKNAKKVIDSIKSRSQVQRTNLTEEQVKQLNDLGYI